MQTIDLINLKAFTRDTGQPTTPELLDIVPMANVQEIEITEEHITVTYNQTITRNYNTNEVTHKEWSYKYNDDAEFVKAIARVIELSRKHLHDLPENIACPPGCAECCSGYEPFVNQADVQRIAEHLDLPINEVLNEYVVQRTSADGYVLGYLRKVTDDVADRCVFLKGSGSGHYYCGIYSARPHDCRDFTPIGCEDVDDSLPRRGEYPVGAPFRPKRRGGSNGSVNRRLGNA
ncbi:MAG: YkgJ family cysteine cluster protein [Candidatus Eremiobacteraeota bacterium]|nr:YkgJ family cysteine cluster protein [Candidatus Eremiobacteraeota bacterium]